MKHFLLLNIFFIYIVSVSAQDFFLEKQKGFIYRRPSVLDSLNIKEPDFMYVDIELRVYYNHFIIDTLNSLFVQIVRDKNGSWSGQSYLYYYYNESTYNYKDVDIKYLSFEKWDKTWKTIIKENFLNLPAESDIKQEEKPLIFIADGHSYTIEILTKKIKRRISYNNPETIYEYCSEYSLDCCEYKKFLQLINFLQTGLYLPLPFL